MARVTWPRTSSLVKLPTRVSSSDSPRGTSTPSVSAHLRPGARTGASPLPLHLASSGALPVMCIIASHVFKVNGRCLVLWEENLFRARQRPYLLCGPPGCSPPGPLPLGGRSCSGSPDAAPGCSAPFMWALCSAAAAQLTCPAAAAAGGSVPAGATRHVAGMPCACSALCSGTSAGASSSSRGLLPSGGGLPCAGSSAACVP